MSKRKTNLGLISLSTLLVAGAVYVKSPQVTVLANDDIGGRVYENGTVKEVRDSDSTVDADIKNTLSGVDNKESQPEKESDVIKKDSSTGQSKNSGSAVNGSSEKGGSEATNEKEVSTPDSQKSGEGSDSALSEKKIDEVKILEDESPEETDELKVGDIVINKTQLTDTVPEVYKDLINITRKDGAPLHGDEFKVYSNTVLIITTSDPLILSTNGNRAGFAIWIPDNTEANLTFNNVFFIVGGQVSTIDISKNGGKLNLTLADNSTNTVSGDVYKAPIHCPPGATLTIDDEIENKEIDGREIIPEGGVIPFDCKVKHKDEIIDLKEGDPATKLDSPDVGKLNVSIGNARAIAVIGGNIYEDGGTMNFNGGEIVVSNIGYNGGATIGGGAEAAGTGPDDTITFNGGSITIQGSGSGATVGGGGRVLVADLPYQIPSKASDYPGGSGNITINAGRIFTIGATVTGASRVIGAGVAVNGAKTDARKYKIRITGGNLELIGGIATAVDANDPSNVSDIIISGGSVAANLGASDHAYSDDSKTTEVFMYRINLKGMEDAWKYIDSMDISVAGRTYQHRQSQYLSSEATYDPWLPKIEGDDEIRIKIDINDDDGERVPYYDFTLNGEQSKTGNILKQWGTFRADGSLKKKYDGKPFNQGEISYLINQNLPILVDPMPKSLSTGAYLIRDNNGTNWMTFQIKKVSEGKDGGSEPEESAYSDIAQQKGSGKYELFITSTQFGTITTIGVVNGLGLIGGYTGTFWGHKGTYDYLEVEPATSSVTTSIEEGANSSISLKTTVRPGDGEATTCQAPRGTVKYYAVVDGKEEEIGSVDLNPVVYYAAYPTSEVVKDFGGVNYHYSEGSFNWTPEAGKNYEKDTDNQYKIISKYIPGPDLNDVSRAVNYTESETRVVETADTDGNNDAPKNPVNVDIDGNEKPDINIDTNGDGEPDLNVDTNGDGIPDINIVDKNGDGEPDRDINPDDGIKPDTNIDTNGDREPDLNVDTNGDGVPDINIVDTNGDGKPDRDINPDGGIKPDTNIDTNGDGEPDLNVDTNGDGIPDINIVDKNKDGVPDTDIDQKGGITPDVNIDTNGDKEPDINVDKDKDGKPDINIDTNGDGEPDLNVDTNGDGVPDINIVDKNGDGEPDKGIYPDDGVTPDVNIDKDGDGNPDINIDTDGNGKPDINVDTDGDGEPDLNVVNTNFTVDETTKPVGGEEKTELLISEEGTETTREITFGENGEDGKTPTVKLTPKDSDGQYPGEYTYTGSDDSVATIDEDGNVTFKTTGVVTFTVTNKVKVGEGKYLISTKKITYIVKPKDLAKIQEADNGESKKAGSKKTDRNVNLKDVKAASHPKTGDRSSVYMWTGVFAAAAASAAVSAVALLRKRRRR